jgi:hypothetical protein
MFLATKTIGADGTILLPVLINTEHIVTAFPMHDGQHSAVYLVNYRDTLGIEVPFKVLQDLLNSTTVS